jgi:MFS family permease
MATILGKPVFYGWIVVAVAWVLYALNLASFTWGFTVFVQPLGDEFGWSRTSITTAWACSLGWTLLLGPWFGRLFDAHGPRPQLIAGGITTGLGWMLMPLASEYWMFFLLFVFGVGTTGSPGASTIAQWFTKRRSLAMGIYQTSSGGAGILLIPVLSALVDSEGWRTGAVVLGALTAVCTFAAVPLMRHRPELYGETPDGIATEANPARGRSRLAFLAKLPLPARTPPTRIDYTLGEAMRASAFWVFSAAIWLRYLGMGMSQVHFLPFVTGQGYSHALAASVLSMSLVVNIPVRVYIGWLGDIYEHKWLLNLCAVSGGIALFALTLSEPSIPGLIWVYPLLWGVGLAMLPLQAAWLGDVFGRRNYGAISSMSNSITLSGRIAGALLAAAAFDVLGSYDLVFLAGSAGFFVGAVLLAFLPRVPQPVRAADTEQLATASGRL